MELNSQEIQKIIPHRYPFLMVDRITDVEPNLFAKGIKCVSANEMHFLGHFPHHPVMPGVLIIEALAQVGAICVLMAPENKGKLALFGGIKEAKFRQQVVPGDVLHLECEIIKQKGPIGIGKATAMVGDKVAAVAQLTFALVDGQQEGKEL